MEKQTLLFLGSKPVGYHCLHYLIQEKDKLNLDIVGVLTNDNPVFSNELSLRKLAELNGIQIIHSLSEIPKVDLIYSVQYHEIFKEADIQKAKHIALNLHMAPLPEYRGCNQFSFAIAEGKKEFGVTIHKMDAGIDQGDILFEKRFPIPENCWVDELYEISFTASIDLFIETIHPILNKSYALTPQENLIASRGTSIHYRKEINALKEIDLAWDKEKIERNVRATYMPGFEPPYVIIDNKKMYFKREWK